MDYGKVLAATGASGLLIGGVVISQTWLISTAIAIVAICAIVIRVVWRHGKSINKV